MNNGKKSFCICTEGGVEKRESDFRAFPLFRLFIPPCTIYRVFVRILKTDLHSFVSISPTLLFVAFNRGGNKSLIIFFHAIFFATEQLLSVKVVSPGLPFLRIRKSLCKTLIFFNLLIRVHQKKRPTPDFASRANFGS